MQPLPRIRAGLLTHALDRQVLVYDPRDSKVHLLDRTTGCVADLLGQGRLTSEEVTAAVAMHLDVAPDPRLVTLAIEELRRTGLLDEASEVPSALPDVSRRELVRSLAAAGAAALLIPAVATLTATAGYAQASGGGAVGDPCTIDSQCREENCCGGFCGIGADAGKRQPGVACNGHGQCCSNNCSNTSDAGGGVCVALPR